MSGRRQAGTSRDAVGLVARWLDDHEVPGDDEPPPGFGHVVYEGPDPRAEAILDVLADLDPALHGEVTALTVEAARRWSLFANVDLGRAAAVHALGWPADAADALFLLARIPGLAAHLVEEYPHRLRFRSRSV